MRDNRSWNPNTKYGRRKNRERAARNYANASPEEKAEIDQIGCIVVGVILAILFIGIIIKGYIQSL